jgi:hypothetical protein
VSPTLPFGRGRRRRDADRRALLRGQAVEVTGKLRRTSARGWGPWTDATIVLEALPDGMAWWHVDDPVAVGLPTTRGPVDAAFAEVDEVRLRAVRFRTEAFWGMDGDIVVISTERATTELALAPDLTAPVADRLRDLLGLVADE